MFRFFKKKTPPPVSPWDEATAKGDYRSLIAIIDAEQHVAPDPARLFVALQFRAYTEDFEGALADLDAIMRLAPDCEVREATLPLLENARKWHDRQTIPGYVDRRATVGGDPPDYAFQLSIAAQHHAKGETDFAGAAIAAAKENAPKVSGTLRTGSGDSIPFADFVDADDLTGPSLICSSDQGLLDIPFEHIESVDFEPRRCFRETIWNDARVVTWAGEVFGVQVFAYYVGTGCHESEHVRMLRMTKLDCTPGYAIAVGQRDYRYTEPGDDREGLIGINQINRIVFHRR